MSVHARHACCEHVALRQARCCCGPSQRTAQLVSTAGTLQHEQASHVFVAIPCRQMRTIEAGTLLGHRMHAGHGPSPPDTPIRNHTQLLL
jgi:hypothetical protein